MMALFGATTVPCPYCYQRIDPEQPAFRCPGHPAPGRDACERQIDAVRLKVLGVDDPVLPSFKAKTRRWTRTLSAICPSCLGDARTLVCPNCHSVLPKNFTSKSPLIGMVGALGSGKTVMLTVLSKELRTSVYARLGGYIVPSGDSNLIKRLEKFRRNLEGDCENDEDVGILPDPTGQRSPLVTVPAVYEWRGPRGDSRDSTILSFYDAAGEDVATADKAREQHYLAAADGLILLLDPFGFPHNRDLAHARGADKTGTPRAPGDVLHAITEMLREAERLPPHRKVKRPLAVVLAKIDAFFTQVDPDDPIRRPSGSAPGFDESESLDLHHRAEALVSEWGGDDVLALLRLNYSTYRLFVASALGAEPDYRAGKASSRGVLPHRVAEPILWLMSLRGFVPRV